MYVCMYVFSTIYESWDVIILTNTHTYVNIYIYIYIYIYIFIYIVIYIFIYIIYVYSPYLAPISTGSSRSGMSTVEGAEHFNRSCHSVAILACSSNQE